MSDAPWTIGRLLNWTTDFLKEKGAESPRLDAEVLLAHVRGCKRIELYTAFEEPASEELRAKFRELVKQRAAGKPVAYLVGHREFFSLPFAVTPDVLIPRPETELLVVRALDLAKPQPRVNDPPERDRNDAAPEAPAPKPTPAPLKPITIADVGTGSGIVAVTLAKHLPQRQGDDDRRQPRGARRSPRRNAERTKSATGSRPSKATSSRPSRRTGSST